jgi:predicted PurR-regulated permease PerM
VGQLLAMLFLGVLTACGLVALGVPYWLAFGAFTGLVAVVPFFGTLVSTLLPALFVIGGENWVKVIAVILLGVVVHLIEANVIVPRIMERKVSLPPVLTIASVPVPVLAVTMVVVRHVLQGAIYGEGVPLEAAVLRTTGQHRTAEAPPVPA